MSGYMIPQYHTPQYIYIYIYIYKPVALCVKDMMQHEEKKHAAVLTSMFPKGK